MARTTVSSGKSSSHRSRSASNPIDSMALTEPIIPVQTTVASSGTSSSVDDVPRPTATHVVLQDLASPVGVAAAAGAQDREPIEQRSDVGSSESNHHQCASTACAAMPLEPRSAAVATKAASASRTASMSVSEAVRIAKRIVDAAGLDVGGIEYLETVDGRRVFYDINANSNLRPSVAAEFGFNPFERVVDYLVAQLQR